MKHLIWILLPLGVACNEPSTDEPAPVDQRELSDEELPPEVPSRQNLKKAKYIRDFHVFRCADRPEVGLPDAVVSQRLFGRRPLSERRALAALAPYAPLDETLADKAYFDTLPPALREFCFAVAPVEVRPPYRDYLAVAPMSPSTYTESVFEYDAKRVRGQFGDFVPPTSPIPESARARLVLLDTAPTAGPGAPPGSSPFDRNALSDHGSTLANIAGAAACGSTTTRGPTADQSNCAIAVHTVQALSQVALPTGSGEAYAMLPSSTGTGYIGSIGELAVAVDNAVSDYMTDRRDAMGLVLNLSLGFGKTWDIAGDAGVQGLHSALMRARCNGALILAAEGNGYTPGHATEMLVPARWYKKSDELGGTGGDGPHDCTGFLAEGAPARWNLTAPLVYPVGGVVPNGAGGWKDSIDSVPTGARATLRAFSGSSSALLPSFLSPPPVAGDDHAISANGTSVSTVLVATAAAIRWGMGPDACAGGFTRPATAPFGTGDPDPPGFDPYLAEEVMLDVLRGCSGTGPTMFSRTTSPSSVPRVAGLTVVRLCESPTIETECAKPGPAPGTPPAPAPATLTTPTCGAPISVTGCTAPQTRRCSGAPLPTGCASNDVFSPLTVDWVLPMPPPPFCPACVWAPPPAGSGISTGILFTEYAPTLGATGTEASATLVLANKTGSTITPVATYLDLGISTTADEAHRLPAPTSTVNVAWLSVFDDAGNSTSCPVRVLGSTP